MSAPGSPGYSEFVPITLIFIYLPHEPKVGQLKLALVESYGSILNVRVDASNSNHA